MHGGQEIKHTLRVFNAEGLTIKGCSDSKSIIHCKFARELTDEGSGLVFQNVTNLSISNVEFEGCGVLNSAITALRVAHNFEYRSAIYIINSANIKISKTTFKQNQGKALSMIDVHGFVEISHSVFTENKVPNKAYFGGGIDIQLALWVFTNVSDIEVPITYKTAYFTITVQQVMKLKLNLM